jgi:hypothetical protein
MRDVLAVMVDDIADDEGGARQPGHAAQGLEIGLQHEVAVAARPGGGLVAGHRLDLHVDGQQIVAGVGLLHAALQEEMPGVALAHQPPLHVDHADEDGIDLAGFDQAFQRVEVEIGGHGSSLSVVVIRVIRPLRPGFVEGRLAPIAAALHGVAEALAGGLR